MGAEIFPLFHHFAIRQTAHTVFAAVRIFTDFRFPTLLFAEHGSRVCHAHFGRSGFGLRISVARTGSLKHGYPL